MIKAPEIGRPLPLPRIQRARQQKNSRPHLARRFEKQLFEQRLAVRRKGAHVAQVAAIDGGEVGAEVQVGIHASVERLNPPRTPALPQLGQRVPAGE